MAAYHENNAIIEKTIREVVTQYYESLLIKYSSNGNTDNRDEVVETIYDILMSDDQRYKEVDEMLAAGLSQVAYDALFPYIKSFIEKKILATPLSFLAFAIHLYGIFDFDTDEEEATFLNEGAPLIQFGDDVLGTFAIQVANYGYFHARFLWSQGHEIENYLPKVAVAPNTSEGRCYEMKDGLLVEKYKVKSLFDLSDPADSAELLGLLKTLFVNELLTA